MTHPELILILDFGSQYTQLIARRVRELGVYSELHPYNISVEKIRSLNPAGIILSGSPFSTYDKDAPFPTAEIFTLGVPLITANKTIGVMVVQHYTDAGAYGPKEQHMLEFVSSQVARAVERKKTEVALRESEERYRQMSEDDLTGDFISTPDGQLLACNPAFARIFGFGSVEEALKSDCKILHKNPESREGLFDAVRTHRKLEYYETELRTKDGKPIHVIANLGGSFDEHGNLVTIKGYLYDNTERRRLEEQLLHAQKLEAVGQLASGIAHDFNNVMGIALTAAQMIKTRSGDAEITRYAQMIEETTLRGGAIAKQLLQFSRAETTQLRPVSLSHIVTEVKKILDHSFPKTIVINLAINLKQGLVMGDEGHIHQVLLNLCINARDAMTSRDQREQGMLTIALESVTGEHIQSRFGEVDPGEYAVIRVQDTGSGIPDDVRRRIFEPFFTTKWIGKGTGLGLSIVHGIVRNHNGHIDVASQVGVGTTFSIYLPLVGEQDIIDPTAKREPASGRGETILVVEDEEILRQLMKEMLERSGYRTLEARDGKEGVELYAEHGHAIDLVISDMGLPYLSGEQVFQRLKEIDPEARLIFSTGYIKDEKKQELMDAGAIDFIHKPYRINEMLHAIRRALDAVPSAGSRQ